VSGPAPEVRDPRPGPTQTAVADPIRAAGLGVGYEGRSIVAGIDVTVRPQTSLALVGTNGSGKSTLLKTIVGLTKPIGGSLTVFDRPPGESPRRIAYLSQFHASGFVLPLRAVEVVRMGRYPELGLLGRMSSEDHDLVVSAMRTMGVDRFADEALRSLSGGQQQRVYLAQVLARRADLVVLDEPTAGLDAGAREIYLEAFAAELIRGAALVTATHDIQEAAEYDQVMLLARRVVALGPGREVLTPEALLETFGMFVQGTAHHGRFIVADRGGPEVGPHGHVEPSGTVGLYAHPGPHAHVGPPD
jgi:ABC-type Mn2+/Zn2+ transport system ATPase subunit